uniref:Putative histone H1 n=1 Tax=Davidia involucrata TaxID=16924 RepID=A0A5B6ZG02_DAVIN
MDPSPDLPATTELAVHTAPAANPTPSHAPNHDHPPYAEMITAAITALKDKNGSSRQAIAKYIDKAYTNLPPTHSALLTRHLKRLKNNGHLVMVKHSYKLPRSVPVTLPGNGSSGPKRGPGRPPKPKPETEPKVGTGLTVTVPESLFVSLGLGDGPATTGLVGSLSDEPTSVKRGPGRPRRPKSLAVLMGQDAPKRGRGRPPRTGPMGAPGSAKVPRPRGRPTSTAKASGRPRGRPRKGVGAVGSGGLLPIDGGANGVLPVKRRGRRPKVAGAKKTRKLTGRPLGRPKKNASTTVIKVSAQQQLLQQQMMAYEDLKSKLGHFQSRVKQAVGAVKPHLNAETAVGALGALQELEELATMDVSAPSLDVPTVDVWAPLNVQSQELHLQN